ncbi:MAG TPA: hypothetical protein VN132_04165, partial [Bdellovibrio sp.]|nr:hypothetical protein [Bdellovibrio sp.]
MKTNTLISFLLLSVLSFTACTPRDVKVVDANTRMKINAKKGKGGGANQKKVSPQEFALSNYSLSAFLAEKQIEAIEFVKLATGSADAKKTQYIVSPAEDADGGVKSLKIFTNKEELQYTTEAGSWIAKANKYLAVTYALKDGVIDSLSVQGS